MVEEFDIVVRNARTRPFPDKLVDIGIRERIIAEISSKVGRGEIEVDAKGNLVTESFVNWVKRAHEVGHLGEPLIWLGFSYFWPLKRVWVWGLNFNFFYNICIFNSEK